ncbi:MAG TPA: hypothetical protein PLN63_00095 [Paludibacteraceae bacterium]|nr:hypothetical protein [Paludibacteraceae bacterium]
MADKITKKQSYKEWDEYIKQWLSDVEVLTNETPIERENRIAKLECYPERWFAYYFPKYCTSEPADFHKKATSRLLSSKKWYEVRAWSRELAKSARSMMEILYLALTGQIENVLLVSNSKDNADRLLMPFMINLEKNLRIVNDYGEQRIEGKWEAGEFTAKCGCSFRALGAGQSPRGTRNEAKRPDFILIDDIDTDEECLNSDRIDKKWDWIEQALIPTVSISGDCRILFNGNIIAKDCCITRAIKMANHADVVNIRDEHGKSTWPSKNSEEDIDFFLSKISTRSAQQEYFNNPISEGEIFKCCRYGKIPPLSKFKFLIAYGDPAPSENKTKMSSTKTAFLCGMLDGVLYVIKGYLDRGTNDEFINWFIELQRHVDGKTNLYSYIENNKLQDPFFQQVFKPIVARKRHELGIALNILPDTKKKTDKATRIEANLEPLDREGRLVFNEVYKNNPHMQRLVDQFKLFSLKLKYPADGPDCIEGALRTIEDKQRESQPTVTVPISTLTRRNKKRL